MEEAEDSEEEQLNEKNSCMGTEISEEKMQRIERFVEQWTKNGCYLKCGLKLPTTAAEIGVPQYQLSGWLRQKNLKYSYKIQIKIVNAKIKAKNIIKTLQKQEMFFMGLFVFNILHMYLGGAMGYGFYTTIFSHFLNEDMINYSRQLTLTHLDFFHFDFGAFMGDSYLHSMMLVAIKQVYGYVIWFSLLLASIFLFCDIPAVRTNIRKVPLWPVLAIEYLARKHMNV